jgi:hypothetical protein
MVSISSLVPPKGHFIPRMPGRTKEQSSKLAEARTPKEGHRLNIAWKYVQRRDTLIHQ